MGRGGKDRDGKRRMIPAKAPSADAKLIDSGKDPGLKMMIAIG